MEWGLMQTKVTLEANGRPAGQMRGRGVCVLATVRLLAGSCNVGKFWSLDGLVALMRPRTCRQHTGRGGARGGRKKRGQEGRARFKLQH